MKWLLTGGGPCKNRTTRVLFIIEVRTHLGAIHFTSDGPRGSRGGEGWVICCRHDFFSTHSFAIKFFLKYAFARYFHLPPTLYMMFFFVWMGLKKSLKAFHYRPSYKESIK